MTATTTPRPTSGDIIELVSADHRTFESLLRDCRGPVAQRQGSREQLATLLVAHSEAEEATVYPMLKQKVSDIGQHEVEHGKEEHAEGVDVLLEFLECKGTDTKKYEEACTKLSVYLCHHFAEEEFTILTPAMDELSEAKRREIGAAFLTRRNEMLDTDCGSLANVQKLVETKITKGLVEPGTLPKAPQD